MIQLFVAIVGMLFVPYYLQRGGAPGWLMLTSVAAFGYWGYSSWMRFKTPPAVDFGFDRYGQLTTPAPASEGPPAPVGGKASGQQQASTVAASTPATPVVKAVTPNPPVATTHVQASTAPPAATVVKPNPVAVPTAVQSGNPGCGPLSADEEFLRDQMAWHAKNQT